MTKIQLREQKQQCDNKDKRAEDQEQKPEESTSLLHQELQEVLLSRPGKHHPPEEEEN